MSGANVVDFPRVRSARKAPDYRLPNAAYYAASEAVMLIEDLACRIETARALGRSTRRRLARRAGAIADLLGQALHTTETLP